MIRGVIAALALAAAFVCHVASAVPPSLGYLHFQGPGELALKEIEPATSRKVSEAGGIELFVRIALDSWKPSDHQALLGANRGNLQLLATKNGNLKFNIKLEGAVIRALSAPHHFVDGSQKWLRVTFVNGVVSFYYSDEQLNNEAIDQIDWIQLGTTIPSTVVGQPKAISSLALGQRKPGDERFSLSGGRFYGIKVVSVDGLVLTDADFATSASGWEDWSLSSPLKYVAPPSTPPSTPPSNEHRSNLIVILTDQQRYDTIRMVQKERGWPEESRINTPNLDRIAREGAYFRNAYTHCAVCGPARAAFLFGRTIENTGLRTNRLAKDENLPGSDAEIKLQNLRTYDDILVKDYGYTAEYYGKWHTPNSMAFGVYGNDVRMASGAKAWFGKYHEDGSKHYSWGMSEWYRMWLSSNPNATSAKEPSAFGDQFNSFSKHYYAPDPLDSRYGTETSPPVYAQQPDLHGMNRLQDGLSITAQQASETIEALERLVAADRPFSLHLSLHSPHAPMIPTKKYHDMYNPSDMMIPASLDDDMENSAYASLRSQRLEGYDDPDKNQRWTASYFGLITEIDEWIGEILDKIDELGIAEDTLLAFSTDHGEMLGAHGMREKNNFYEESTRVPLLLRMPGTIPAGTVVDDPVSHLDLHSTFLDYVVGKTADYATDGESLRNEIEDLQPFSDPFVVTMWNWTDITDGYLPSRDPAFMVRKGHWKLILSCFSGSGNLDMLYNLKEDPGEMNNLIGKNGNSASTSIIGKAEHLKAVLVKYLKESNHPATDEVQRRRTWRYIPFWVGDAVINFRDTLVDGTRTEYIYIGSRNQRIVSIIIEGDQAGRYGLKLVDFQYGVDDEGFGIVAIRYRGSDFLDTYAAIMKVKLDGGEERRVILNPPRNITVTGSSETNIDLGFFPVLSFSLELTAAPTHAPTTFTGCTGPSILGPNEFLHANRDPSFICSPNGQHHFGLERDGDLSLFHGPTKVWSANTCCKGNNPRLVMQKGDGNLVLYVDEDNDPGNRKAVWSSKTIDNANALLAITDDGKAKIVSADGNEIMILWEALNIFSHAT